MGCVCLILVCAICGRHCALRMGSDTWCQVYIDGTQHRHDGQVEEGEACKLGLRGGGNEGWSHGEQHAHCPVNPASVPLQDLPHRTKIVLSVCVEVGWK